jgi:hypothetical protein
VSEGIAGVRLGMTQAQVAARVGKPYAMSIPIANVTCGMYARNTDFGSAGDWSVPSDAVTSSPTRSSSAVSRARS